MDDIRLVTDLFLGLGAAVLGGLLAQRLGLPVLLGYIAAGVIIGPNTPGFVADRDRVQLLANLGVAFLMFALGVEFSLNDLLKVRRVALITAGLQLPFTIALGLGVGLLVGWSIEASILLGGAFAISSSIVAIKILMGRGEMTSPHGALAVGVSVVQDLSLVVMLALLPILTGESDNLLLAVGESIGIALIALSAVIVIGTRVVPRILGWVAQFRSRELFLLVVVVIALGTAVAAHEAGLSFALGAFLAGLIVSESEFDAQVAAQIAPLRDIFATLFFVAIGMLLQPHVIMENLGTVVVLIAALVIGKMLITGGALLAAGVDHWTATRGAIVLAQMAEFSFVLAGVGLGKAIIDDDQYGLILTAAIGSIVLLPVSLAFVPRLTTIATRLPAVARRERDWVPPAQGGDQITNHVVIAGFGRIGTELARSLAVHKVPYTVVDLNPAMIRQIRETGVIAEFGDSGEEILLERLGIEHARTLAVTVPDITAARATITTALRMNPRLTIIARATSQDLVDPLTTLGAREIVQPEFEAAMEFSRQVLAWYGVADSTALHEIDDRRSAVYRLDRARPEFGGLAVPEPNSGP